MKEDYKNDDITAVSQETSPYEITLLLFNVYFFGTPCVYECYVRRGLRASASFIAPHKMLIFYN